MVHRHDGAGRSGTERDGDGGGPGKKRGKGSLRWTEIEFSNGRLPQGRKKRDAVRRSTELDGEGEGGKRADEEWARV
jgi:hypothetical protein